MSVIQRKPFIQKVLETIGDLKTTLLSLVNGSDTTPEFRSLVNRSALITGSDKNKVQYVNLETWAKTYSGYLIYNNSYCVLVAFTSNTQALTMLNINVTKATYTVVKEYLDINELRRYLEEADEHIVATEIDSGDATEGQVLTADGDGGASWEDVPDLINEDNVTEGSAVKLFGFDSEGNLVKDNIPEGIVVDDVLDPASDNAVSSKAVSNYLKAHQVEAIKITNPATTLGDVASQLNTINTNGEHVFFDVSALGASMYLCTIFIDTTNNVYRIFDVVVNRISQGTYDSTKLLTMAIANADTIATQGQVDNLQEQINELGGKKVIEDWSSLGALIESGESTSYIEAGDMIDVNWINTVLGTITSGATVTCTDVDTFINKIGEAEAKNYLFVYNGSAWTYNEQVVDLSQYALSVSGTPVTGDVMTIVTTVKKVSYTFVGYDDVTVDENASHNWLLEQTYAPDTKAYDSIEALFNLAQGNTLDAGNYKITVNQQGSANPVTLYFTVTANVSASDGVVQFAPASTSWTSPYYPVTLVGYKKNTNTVVMNQISMSTTEIADAIDVSTVTGITIHDCYYQANFGNNNWERSNIRAWLNDDSKDGNYTASYDFDRPSSYNLGKGFLYGIDPRVKSLILTAVNKFTAGLDNAGYTQNTTYECEDKVFLLSMKEMSFNINTAEGNATDLYSEYCSNQLTNDAVANRSKYNQAGGTKNSYRWSRSASTGYAYYSWRVAASGTRDGSSAFSGSYFAPAFVIGKASN